MICRKQLGEIQPLLISTKTQKVLSMDFITGLPESVEYERSLNPINVVVDQLSKMCHYIPYCSKMSTKKLAKRFTQESI